MIDGYPTFHICMLMYGDHADLARRCLTSLRHAVWWGNVLDVRIGFNDACPLTRGIASEVAGSFHESMFWGFDAGKNVGKYPMMRRMLYDVPLGGDYVIWFDDDSYWTVQPAGSYLGGVVKWWDKLSNLLKDCSMLGSVYHLNRKCFDHRFKECWYGIRAQPWFTGKKPCAYNDFEFVTGGWWAISTKILKKHDWPPYEVFHTGGDTLLGEMCRQQGYRIGHFNEGVAINAGPLGQESGARRRGFLSSTQPPFYGCNAGTDFVAYRAECKRQWHDFVCSHYRLRHLEHDVCNTKSITPM